MKMYVSNLSFNTGETELHDLFAKYGTVDSANVVLDRETGRSRGFGFVEMDDEVSAQTAISQLNGKEIEGRSLNVSEARPKSASNFGRNNSYDRKPEYKRW